MQKNNDCTTVTDWTELCPNYKTLEPAPTLGSILKAMRICRGETQASLAKKLGTCRQHIQKWEYDVFRPSPKRLKQITQTLRFNSSFKLCWYFYTEN